MPAFFLVPTDNDTMSDRASTALKAYRAKRNFKATPEPADGGVANGDLRAFVIQKHWATGLHYDFRLELDGTMKSWAVPKGPSYDPADKRMAVQVEDHPLSYNTFEGEIPKGNYGAGRVIIWDKGVWIPLEDPHKGYRDGKLMFELRGHKMQGKWTLVRMKSREDERQIPWLLIKERDSFVRPSGEYSVVDEMPGSVKNLEAPAASGPPVGAQPAELPTHLQPQLATLVTGPPADSGQWLYEVKFDGYRMLTRAKGGGISLVTRNGNDWTRKLPELQAALQQMDLPDGWYDGEIIMPSARAPSDFQALQGAFDTARTTDIVYYLFDVPYCAGFDLRQVPLVERRAVLERIVKRKPHANVRFSEVFDAKPEEVVASACKLGLEGVIAKRRDSAYVPRRSPDWIKLKCGHRQEFVIGGFTDPQGERAGIGSLLLGVHDASGTLQYAGNVGTGFSHATLRDLRKKLDALGASQSPFAPDAQIPRRSHFVKPQLICEVSFGEWPRSGRVRHSVFQGLRDDKRAVAIKREKPLAVKKTANRNVAAEPAAAPPQAAELPSTLRVSHADRIIDAQSGMTKIDLVRYYAQVADLMMPHLKSRPVSLVRAPKGIGGELFFQKHSERYKMPGIVELDAALAPGHPPMLEVAQPLGLLSAAQMNVIEFHTWNGVTTAIDKPDRMTFDLDPGEGVSWPQIQEAAQLVHAFLDELGLPSFLKTSGGTNRVGKIFIDYLRNGFGATTVCAWSARSRPGLGISVPVRWDELAQLTGGAHWTVKSLPSRLPVGNTPWDDYDASRAGLSPAMKTLGFTPAR